MKPIFILLLCLLACPACTSSEEKARLRLNQALQHWNQGSYESAMEELDAVVAQYGTTKTATEALEHKRKLLAEYKETFSPERNREHNRSGAGRIAYRAVMRYRLHHQQYPETLAQTQTTDAPALPEQVLASCQYERATLGQGFRLHCTDAGRPLGHKPAATQTGQGPTRNRPQQPADSTANNAPRESVEPPALFPQKSWGAVLNPTGEVPRQGFMAYYLNTKSPTQVIFQEPVADISINYPWDQFHGIPSQDFGAYWVGSLECAEAQSTQLAISQSWSKARVLLDGRLVYEGKSSKRLPFPCSKGRHTLEVEYINNWHTTTFSARIIEDRPQLTGEELRQALQDSQLAASEINVVSVYESKRKDMSLDLRLQKTARPQILMLFSYDPVRWTIINPDRQALAAIVLHSFAPGAQVRGEIQPQTRLLELAGRAFRPYFSKEISCSCVAGHFHCDQQGPLEALAALENLLGRPINGLNTTYGGDSLVIPEVRLSPGIRRQWQEKKREMLEQQQACGQENDPDFNSLMPQPTS